MADKFLTHGMLKPRPLLPVRQAAVDVHRWRYEPIPHVPRNAIVVTPHRVLFNPDDDYEDYALYHATRTMLAMNRQKRRRGAGVP
ncbi:hypothetical protein [Pseudoxanthomonas indica]|uniref:Uncharacterized protein n=1 Tax=Pseudoxanthomonas indica TaxID=428993 RepID=A0A1T5JE44_9GAMM|nr:hypothetical protein [Pseudoxanthomonas indica]GGD58106.1 hypothetical protein GCM10007235_33020 [Pseudoxanthomonas indica]SKC49614.1 hypothetical protein SAMN06296058_0724 [Pseudoxanthomonas indica]